MIFPEIAIAAIYHCYFELAIIIEIKINNSLPAKIEMINGDGQRLLIDGLTIYKVYLLLRFNHRSYKHGWDMTRYQ